ncbi:MAG: hypothetical protein AAF639_16690 [Chloroflexota bacterium]
MRFIQVSDSSLISTQTKKVLMYCLFASFFSLLGFPTLSTSAHAQTEMAGATQEAAAQNAVLAQLDEISTDTTIRFDPFLNNHCGTDKEMALSFTFVDSSGIESLEGKVRRCVWGSFGHSGNYWVLRDGIAIQGPTPYAANDSEIRFGVRAYPSEYDQVSTFQVRMLPNGQSNALLTGVVRAWRDGLSPTYRYNAAASEGCGPNNEMRMSLAPDSRYPRMDLVMTTCSGGDFISDGYYWVTVDGVRTWGPFSFYRGDDKDKVDLNPHGAGLLLDNAAHTYQVEFVYANAQNTVKKSNTGTATLVTQNQYTIQALRNGATWNEVGIWTGQGISGNPSGNGVYATTLWSDTLPMRFIL